MVRHVVARVFLVAVCASAASCAGAIVGPVLSPTKPRGDALLVLPGVGYSRAGEKVLRSLAPTMAAQGVELFVPTYISRSGLGRSRANLQQFIRDHRLDQYEHLHVFAFLAGAWTLNPLLEVERLPNLATVVYDRSPYQERAPRIADEELHFLTWLRYGSPVFDLAKTPYVPLTMSGLKVGIVVETMPTSFIKGHERTARSYGPFHFACDAFMQAHDDCVYLSLSHDEMYTRFTEVWPELLAFIREGRFTGTANRTPPSGDPLADSRPR